MDKLDSYDSIKAILKGPRLGDKVSSEVSLLVERSAAILEICIDKDPLELGENDLREHEKLLALASELQLGGSCEHGADKGPKCRLCGGKLKGKYARKPIGLDAVDFAVKNVHMSKSQKERLLMECDRVGTNIQEAFSKLKLAWKSLEGVRKRLDTAARKPLAKKQKQESNESLEQIKQSMGIDAKAMQRSHDTIQQEVSTVKTTLRVRCGRSNDLTVSVEISKADLEAEYEGATAFEWTCHREIARLVLEKTGRTLAFRGLRSKSHFINDTESLLAAFDAGLGEEVFTLENMRVVSHMSFPECYERCSNSRKNASASALQGDNVFHARLKQQQNDDPSLRLCNWKHIPRALFDSIRYRESITCLDLSCSSFDFLPMAAAVTTLASLQVLRVPTLSTPHGVGTQKGAAGTVCDALKIWSSEDVLAELYELDLSGRSLITSSGDLGATFGAFLRKHQSLRVLGMSRCFNIPHGQALSDDECEAISCLVQSGIAENLPARMESVSFAGNAMVDLEASLRLSRSLLSKCETVSLAECRTWFFAEDESMHERDREESDGLGRVLRSLDCPRMSPSPLSSLTLSGIRIGDSGLTLFAQAGECFPMLTTLRVARVNAGFDGLTKALIAASNKWPRLHTLCISGNRSDSFALSTELQTALRGLLAQEKLKHLEMAGYEAINILPEMGTVQSLVVSHMSCGPLAQLFALPSVKLESVIIWQGIAASETIIQGCLMQEIPGAILLTKRLVQ